MKLTIPKKDILLTLSLKPVSDPITKFGGQPVWISKPQWPISRVLQKKMRFICQIRIRDILPQIPYEIFAYIFVTDYSLKIKEWSIHSGEAAVIIQPDGILTSDVVLEKNGPALFKIEKRKLFFRRKIKRECEYIVSYKKGYDPESFTEAEALIGSSKIDENFLNGNKLGGIPSFFYDILLPNDNSWSDISTPDDHKWYFIMQIEQDTDLFHIDFERSARGFFFLSEDYRQGYLEWQA